MICGPIAPGFKLESLGSPEDAALRFLNTTAAPPGSGFTGTLLAAAERCGCRRGRRRGRASRQRMGGGVSRHCPGAPVCWLQAHARAVAAPCGCGPPLPPTMFPCPTRAHARTRKRPLPRPRRRDAAGVLYYTFEFTIEKAAPAPFLRHNVSVLAARGDVLVSLNAQCPEALWARDGRLLREAADSFRLAPAPPARRREAY